MKHIFTPYGGKVIKTELDDKGRVSMILNDEDYEKIQRGHEWEAVVTNQKTKRKYVVRGANCGFPGCFCAAKIVKEII